MKVFTDNEILELIIVDKHKGFQMIVNQYSSLIFNITYNFLKNKDETEDVSQEIFIKIYNNIEKFKGLSKLSTWIYRIAVNTCKNYIKKNKNKHSVDIDNIVLPVKNNDNERNEMREIISNAVNKLPFKYRTVIILREIEGRSCKEISQILKCKQGTVDSRLFRAREMLRNILQPIFKEGV